VHTTLVELGPVPTDMLARADNYEPTRRSFDRASRMRLSVEVPREIVADKVVAAVRHDRKHVRLPKRTAGFPALTEVPRRITELILTGVPHQAVQ
jgi:hypothetical protein